MVITADFSAGQKYYFGTKIFTNIPSDFKLPVYKSLQFGSSTFGASK